MMDDITGMIVSIFICVVLPVAIVWIVFSASRNSENKRAEVLLKAIEHNANLDADKLAEALAKKPKTPRERQLGRLLRGSIFTLLGIAFAIVASVIDDPDVFVISAVCGAVGIAFLIVYFVGRKAYKE